MRRLVSGLLLALLVSVLVVGVAVAHSGYLRSIPGADAVIASPPERVDIWFGQELFRRQGENTIQVSGPDGKPVSTGETAIDDDDRAHIWVKLLPELAPGKYLVEWRNVSLEDGHASTGSFSFTLDPAAAMTSTPMGATLAATQPAPEVPSAVPTAATSQPAAATQGPCAASLLPVLGLLGLVFGRRLSGTQSI